MREPPKVADWRVCVLTQKSSTPEPSAEFGKLCMLELASFIAATSLGGGFDTEPGRCQSTCAGSAELGPAQRPYTATAVEACMEKVRRLNYNQTASGLVGGFSLTPWPSGYSIGSANWTLTDGNMSVAIIGASTVSPILRHPLPVQLQHLRHFDVAILGDLLPRHRAHTLAPPPPPSHEGGRTSAWHPLPWPKLSQVGDCPPDTHMTCGRARASYSPVTRGAGQLPASYARAGQLFASYVVRGPVIRQDYSLVMHAGGDCSYARRW